MDIRINKRARNRQAILEALHMQGAMQRTELSRRCDIRKNSITSICDELLESGLLRELEPGAIRSPLALNHDRHYAVATMLHEDVVVGTRVYLDGGLSEIYQAPLTDKKPQSAVAAIKDVCARAMAGDEKNALGLGLTSAGIVDTRAGIIRMETKSFGWSGVEWQKTFEEEFGLPVHVDHEVRCQLWAQAWFGKLLEEAGNIFYIAIIEGVGSASIVHGRRVVGDHHSAGEIGHVCCGTEGRLCNCGRVDCLETYCSYPAMLREFGAVNQGSDNEDMAEDKVADNVIDRISERLAGAVAWVMAALDPELVLIGCMEHKYAPALAISLQYHLRGELRGFPAADISVHPLGDLQTATLRGAGALVIEDAFRKATFLKKIPS